MNIYTVIGETRMGTITKEIESTSKKEAKEYMWDYIMSDEDRDSCMCLEVVNVK